MAALATVSAAAKANLPFGTRELYLPDFTVALLRTPRLPATQARFAVPLWFSKLDLRDYLWHGYGVRTRGIRSVVKQSRVTATQETAQAGAKPSVSLRRRWHRPRAKKHMTVELERAFVWPPVPEDLTPWGMEQVQASEKSQADWQDMHGPTADTMENGDRRVAMREQARALLEGKARWEGGARGGMGLWSGLARR